jgi:hypothetical protein
MEAGVGTAVAAGMPPEGAGTRGVEARAVEDFVAVAQSARAEHFVAE